MAKPSDSAPATAQPGEGTGSAAPATRSPFLRPSGGRRQRFGQRGLPRGRGLALTGLTLVLVALAIVAFARTQVLKQVEAPVEDFDFATSVAPTCGCPRDSARLSFRLVEGQTLDAAIVDGSDAPVRSLLADARRPRGRLTIEWDGRDDVGRPVAPGEYRLRLDLPAAGRSVTVPEEVVVRPAALAP